MLSAFLYWLKMDESEAAVLPATCCSKHHHSFFPLWLCIFHFKEIFFAHYSEASEMNIKLWSTSKNVMKIYAVINFIFHACQRNSSYHLRETKGKNHLWNFTRSFVPHRSNVGKKQMKFNTQDALPSTTASLTTSACGWCLPSDYYYRMSSASKLLFMS